jgi:hypothetical protein
MVTLLVDAVTTAMQKSAWLSSVSRIPVEQSEDMPRWIAIALVVVMAGTVVMGFYAWATA